MRGSAKARVDELSRRLGGRFRLTTLIEKQAEQYVRGGRAFMPSVRNLHELFGYILSEIDEGRIGLLLPGEEEREAEPAEED